MEFLERTILARLGVVFGVAFEEAFSSSLTLNSQFSSALGAFLGRPLFPGDLVPTVSSEAFVGEVDLDT